MGKVPYRHYPALLFSSPYRDLGLLDLFLYSVVRRLSPPQNLYAAHRHSSFAQRRSPADPTEEPPPPSLQPCTGGLHRGGPCGGGALQRRPVFFLVACPTTELAFTDLTVRQSATYRPVSASPSPLPCPLLLCSSSQLP
jgi:hypothetical protein